MEMEDTCKNRSTPKEPKATADVLFISTHITDWFKMALWTSKEQQTLITQDLIAQKTIVAKVGRSSGMKVPKYTFLGEMWEELQVTVELQQA